MRADRWGATTPHIWEQIPWLAAIGQQRIEAGATQPEPAAVRLAIINAVVRASIARRTPIAISSVHEGKPRAHDIPLPSRQAKALGRFEKQVLDLFDYHLSEPERGAAVRMFVAYIRVCHAMLDLGFIKESELARFVPGSGHCEEYNASLTFGGRTDARSHQGEPGVAPITTGLWHRSETSLCANERIHALQQKTLFDTSSASAQAIGRSAARAVAPIDCALMVAAAIECNPRTVSFRRSFAFSMVGIFG